MRGDSLFAKTSNPMISSIEALNFRCLRYIHQPTGRFHVLVGPNASGKTTFLDVVAFLADLVSDGLEAAVSKRTQNFIDLVWGRTGTGFEIAIEAQIPQQRQQLLAEENRRFSTIRYEVGIGFDSGTGEIVIKAEQGSLVMESGPQEQQKMLFPSPENPPDTIVSRRKASGSKSLFSKIPGGNDNFYAEAYAKEGRWAPAFRLGPRKSTLGNLPEDESKFPISTWFKQLLSEGVEKIALNSLEMRKPSRPGRSWDSSRTAPTCRGSSSGFEPERRSVSRNGSSTCGRRYPTCRIFVRSSVPRIITATWFCCTKAAWKSRLGPRRTERCGCWP